MKKMLMMAVMVMMLAFSAVCSASNGSVLDAQEKIVTNFLNGSNFKSVAALMNDEMKKNWDEKTYDNFKAQIAKDFGKINTNDLILVEKHKDADILLYQVTSEKVPAARFVFLFQVVKEKPLLADFNVMLPKKEEAPAAEQK